MGFRRTLTKLICVTAFLAWAAPRGAAPATPKAPARETCGTANLLDGRKPLLATPEIKGDLRLVTDGAAAHEGAQWDAPAAVTWDARTASITYDLGAPRPVSALFVQADANDTYQILGSLDGHPASFRVIADVAERRRARPRPAQPRDRDRARDRALPPRRRRQRRRLLLAVGARGVLSTARTSFPPGLRTVDGSPRRRRTAPPRGATSRRATAGQRPRRVAVDGGAARGGVDRGQRGVASLGARGRPAAIGGDAAPAVGAKLPLHDVLRLLFVASGCAALIYEVVWFHLLRLVIGASALSVGIVLASFMGGMFLGSLLFPRYVPAGKNPVRVYAWLEIGIGVFGLLMPLLLPAVRFIYVGLVGYGALGIALRA